MAIEFEKPSPDVALRQGEILADIYEHVVDSPCDEPTEDTELPTRSIKHPYIIVLTQDCDLNQDYSARYPDSVNFTTEDTEKRFRKNPERYRLDHVLVCVVQQEQDFRISTTYEMKADIFRRVKNNQDKRFHHLGPWGISGLEDSTLNLYIDFKRTFSLPTSSLYESVYQTPKRRIALVPRLHALDLSHRHSSFMSRVPLPQYVLSSS